MTQETDRELLELAAKAEGVEIMFWSGRDVVCQSAIIKPDGLEWNPLTDDGDALRLAVKLGMNVFHAGISVYAMDEEGEIETSQGHELDRYAATRRAIVRAAAEIGRAM
jgi:hypothetical protein